MINNSNTSNTITCNKVITIHDINTVIYDNNTITIIIENIKTITIISYRSKIVALKTHNNAIN